MSSLVGLAVIGKGNQPLYMCDCTRLRVEATRNEAKTADADDIFGFAEASRTGPVHHSLPIQHQFLMHAALDRLEELVDTEFTASSNNNNNTTAAGNNKKIPGMAVRRTPPGPTAGAHWLGLLEDVDEWQVYGHITATNIKLFCLARRRGTSDLKKKTPAKIKKFLDQVHSHYIAYVMNSFNEIRNVEPIKSKQFDEGVRRAVEEYHESIPKEIQF